LWDNVYAILLARFLGGWGAVCLHCGTNRFSYDTCNAMDNQRIKQSTPAIFSLKS
jgi:hypothetical protein